MMTNKTYNGWTNYETWAVKLWMDNEQSSSEYWRERTQEAWRFTSEGRPNQFLNHSENARSWLMADLQGAHEDDERVAALGGSVYADLLNAALSEVNWIEIADALLADEQENDTISGYQGLKGVAA